MIDKYLGKHIPGNQSTPVLTYPLPAVGEYEEEAKVSWAVKNS
jgi:hypothetical protein